MDHQVVPQNVLHRLISTVMLAEETPVERRKRQLEERLLQTADHIEAACTPCSSSTEHH